MKTKQLNAWGFGSTLSKQQQKAILGGGFGGPIGTLTNSTYTCSASCPNGHGSVSCTISGDGASCRSDEFNINGVISYRVKCERNGQIIDTIPLSC